MAENATIEEKRAMFDQMEKTGAQELGPLSASLEESWTKLKLPSGYESRTLVVRPKEKSAKSPLIVYWYGGGYTMGTPTSVLRPARDFAEKYGAVVVCPSYRMTPDVRWPVMFKDGWETLAYLAKSAESEFGADLDSGFVIGGVSAGAGIAAIAAGIALYGDGKGDVEELAKPITGVFVSVPFLVTKEILPEEFKSVWTSRKDNRGAPGFDAAAVDRVLAMLQVSEADLQSPWFSPVNAIAKGQKKSTPHLDPAFYLQACQYDPLRDDAVVFEKLLKSKGFKTKIDVFPDDAHAAWTALPLSTKSKDPTIGEATMAGMGWLLESRS